MPRGRPKYEPTPADRNTVRSMAATGFTHAAIAQCVGTNGIDEKTLRRHFRHELDTAANKANAAVANKAYQMAVNGDPPAATFFWLKCRAGWKEKSEIEHSGPNGSKLEIIVTRVGGDSSAFRAVLDPLSTEDGGTPLTRVPLLLAAKNEPDED